MADNEKTDFDSISTRLWEPFSDNEFVAFGRLKETRRAGEAVDVFVNELRRLARLSGLTWVGLEQVVKLYFVPGFLDSFSLELQQIVGVGGMRVSDLISRASVLASSKGG